MKKAKKAQAVQNNPNQAGKAKKQPVSKRWYNALGVGVMALLGFIIYSNSFTATFHFDDTFHIVNNMAIRHLSDLKAIWNYRPTAFQHRPFPIFTFALNYHFSGLNVWSYHLVNLSIHIINALLAGWLTLLIFSSPVLKGQPANQHKKVLALLTALLFVSHPLATQSVTYIVQRMNLLATMFYLLSLALYMFARLWDKGEREKYLLFGAAAFCAMLAILSKENSVTLPLAIALVEICFFRTKPVAINFKDYRVIMLIVTVLAAIVVLIACAQSIFKPGAPSQQNGFTNITSLNYLITQFGVIVKYIQLLFLPISQNLDYDIPLSTTFFGLGTMLSFVFILALLALGAWLFNRHRVISFGIFWFFITLSVESGIIPIDDLMFEHRTYLPSLGFFIIASYCLYIFLWNNYKNIAIGILAAVIGFNSILTYQRNKVWATDLTLWDDVASKSPHKARAFENRGMAYSALGKNEEAIKDFNTAIALMPKFAGAYTSRGCAKQTLGNLPEAINDFNMSISLDPTDPVAFNNRGYAEQALGKNEEAINDYNAAMRLRPGFAEAINNRGNAYMAMGRYDDAMRDFETVIKQTPDYPDSYYNRGSANLRQGKTADAINDFNTALRLKPDFAQAYSNRGMANAMLSKDFEAGQDFDAAIKIKPDYADAYSNRGNLHYSRKEYEAAINDYTSAINLNPGYAQAYNNRGFAYMALQKYATALEDLKRAKQLGFNVDPGVLNSVAAKI